jgi:hypothetical protein
MYLRGAQSFQIRRSVEDLFDAPDVVSSIEILKDFGTTAQGFYEEALLKEQWEAADVDQREARLLKDIRYANKLDLGEYGEEAHARPPRPDQSQGVCLRLGFRRRLWQRLLGAAVASSIRIRPGRA